MFAAGGRKLVFFGVKNTVVCRDVTNPGSVSEIWKYEMGKKHINSTCETNVVSSGGLIVARYDDKIAGLDPLNGIERWGGTLKNPGVLNRANIIPTPSVVYIGAAHTVTAISSSNGQVLWEFAFSSKNARVPTIVVCGTGVFVACTGEIAYLNAGDGSVIWKTKFDFRYPYGLVTAAWDGADCVFLGSCGHLYRCNLRDGSKISDTKLFMGSYDLNLFYDNSRKRLYVASNNKLFAISGSEEKTEWVSKVPSSLMSPILQAISVDTSSGRIFIAHARKFICFDSDGKLIFANKMKEPKNSGQIYTTAAEFGGKGMILVGCCGSCRVYDGDGTVILADDLSGMGYDLVNVCTLNANPDSNASCQPFCRFH